MIGPGHGGPGRVANAYLEGTYNMVIVVIDRVPGLGAAEANLRQRMVDARMAARAYTRAHGQDDPAITDWTWPY